jgi:hypothetical protein
VIRTKCRLNQRDLRIGREKAAVASLTLRFDILFGRRVLQPFGLF